MKYHFYYSNTQKQIQLTDYERSAVEKYKEIPNIKTCIIKGKEQEYTMKTDIKIEDFSLFNDDIQEDIKYLGEGKII